LRALLERRVSPPLAAHNDANVLSMGERMIPEDLALKIVRIWLETDFDGGRHERRVAMLNAM
jgi:Ribose 5-phosphate isomerase RpiB